MITLQVGEKKFKVSCEMLKNSGSQYFKGLVDSHFKKETEFFIDRDDTHFDLILKLLRNGSDPKAFANTLKLLTVIDKESVMNECKFYGMDDVVSFIEVLLFDVESDVKYATVMFYTCPTKESNEEKRKLETLGYKYINQSVYNDDIYTLFFEKRN
jgi:hypothetical protein